MRLRWRKKRNRWDNTLTINAHFIRAIVAEEVDFPMNAVLYDYVKSLPDDDLEWLGTQILDDPELWLCLTDVIISHTVSLRFTDLLEETGLEPK